MKDDRRTGPVPACRPALILGIGNLASGEYPTYARYDQ